MRVLLVDHGEPGATLARTLQTWNVHTTVAPSEGPLPDAGVFDAVVLAPRASLDGRTDHCRRLRAAGYRGPILSFCHDAVEGEALLQAGADDFVILPYETFELVTRLKAGVRRATARWALRWGPFELDRAARIVRVGDSNILLSARECELMACLMEEEGRVVSRADLRERVWHTKDRGTNLVEVHLSRLRDKLGQYSGLIETVRGAGYRLRPRPSHAR